MLVYATCGTLLTTTFFGKMLTRLVYEVSASAAAARAPLLSSLHQPAHASLNRVGERPDSCLAHGREHCTGA